jgi:hypothetical protein
MAQQPLGSDRSSFLGCYIARRRLMWSWMLTWRWRLTWSKWLPEEKESEEEEDDEDDGEEEETHVELGGQDGDPSSWQASVGGHQLEWLGTLHLCQHEAWDLLPVVIPQHGSCGRSMRGCVLVDPQALR